MAEWKIQLKAAGYNKWLSFMEEQLTGVRDQLDILEKEEKQLSGIWQSDAEKQWKQEFFRELTKVREALKGMEELLLDTGEEAKMLVRLEKSMITAAEGL